ncbi:hypothetical protein [Rufibacter radiotolerans]|uniref:hypothetical protein n=1 Tax=Rufibacter radiotolerans TaxID=1379910 RepID=UPI000AA3C5F0|nr:hypothetical protein [Rufibacter radiotolerans]
MREVYLFLLLLFGIVQAHAQAPTKNSNLRVFVDCQAYCDQDYLKREITYVDYVNDRFQSNVYVLITSQQTGSGGREYKLQFSGQGRFVGMTDTLSYIRPATATDDEDRKQAIEKIKLGLLPFLLKTDKAKDLVITFKSSEEAAATSATTSADDPWNFWVFNVNLRGYFSGDKNYSNSNLNGSFSAGRVTDKLKTNFSISADQSKNRYGEGENEFKFSNRRYDFNNLTVWSLTDHLSAGGYLSAQRADYSNYDLTLAASPAIEYNFFPYKESNNSYVGLMYKAGPRYFDYKQETIYFKMKELRFQQTLSLDLSFNQKWGQISGSTSYSQYFHDFSKDRLSFSGYADIRIFKGFSFNLGGYYAYQRDQLNIIKGDVSDEDLFTRRRQLDSNFDFFFNFGIRYRFGSIFNNVVNPRFQGGGGSFFYF